MAILKHSCSPVEDGILHNTPALHLSNTPFKNHATAEPSLHNPPFEDPVFLCGGGPGFKNRIKASEKMMMSSMTGMLERKGALKNGPEAAVFGP